MSKVMEMMVRVQHKKKTVRLWIMLGSTKDCTKENMIQAKNDCHEVMHNIQDDIDGVKFAEDEKPPTLVDWAEAIYERLSSVKHNYVINAVEVLNKKGNGGLYYPDWP